MFDPFFHFDLAKKDGQLSTALVSGSYDVPERYVRSAYDDTLRAVSPAWWLVGRIKDAVQRADHRSSFQSLQYHNTPADRHRAERECCIASAYCRIVAEEAREEAR